MDAAAPLTLEQPSIDFMRRHKYDDAMMRHFSEVRCHLPAGSDSANVRTGGAGGHAHELPADVSAAWTRSGARS